MADVFISYRNTPERRAFVRRLAAVLNAHHLTVWWDYGLEAGESYRSQIMAELAAAKVVAPLWCAESIVSKWVAMEAEFGKDKLMPARLQKVAPPDAFEAIQAADLTAWDGGASHARLIDYVRLIARRAGKPGHAPSDVLEELAGLPKLTPLPSFDAGGKPARTPSTSASDADRRLFEEVENAATVDAWQFYLDEFPQGMHAPVVRFKLKAAKERAATEAAAQRQAAEAAIVRFRAEGRIPVRVTDGAGEKVLWPKPGAGEVWQDCWLQNGQRMCGPEMVVVPAGRFVMGSNDGAENEKPPHEVTIARPFAVGRYAVTFDEWDVAQAHPDWLELAGIAPRKPIDHDWGRDRRPVIDVRWDDATAYCRWLSHVTAQSYRLLSEAQWEYACRGGTSAKYSVGETITKAQAQFSEDGIGSAMHTLEVGQFPPNGFGLYDMHGNVWEWCQDVWHDTYAGAPRDGTAWALGKDTIHRPIRGGSWASCAPDLRSARRGWVKSDTRSNGFGFFLNPTRFSVGFRLARTLDP